MLQSPLRFLKIQFEILIVHGVPLFIHVRSLLENTRFNRYFAHNQQNFPGNSQDPSVGAPEERLESQDTD